MCVCVCVCVCLFYLILLVLRDLLFLVEFWLTLVDVLVLVVIDRIFCSLYRDFFYNNDF